MGRSETDIISQSASGLYCAAGDFWIDPINPVDRAVITHAHSDHARSGMGSYLTHKHGVPLLKARIGAEATVQGIEYGRPTRMKDAVITLFPAGHILGSSQVRIEVKGRTAVVSGDYKRDTDPTCTDFEPVRCNEFISEATFAIPVFRWDSPSTVVADIESWWNANISEGVTSVLFVYALGKAQRILASLTTLPGPLRAHGAITKYDDAYRSAGVTLPSVTKVTSENAREQRGRSLVLAPPSAQGTSWQRKLGPASTGFASGWMRIRGRKRQRGVDRGFILSDHADWAGLLETVKETTAEHVRFMHGYTEPISRLLIEQGLDARPVDKPEFSVPFQNTDSGRSQTAISPTLWDLNGGYNGHLPGGLPPCSD